MQAALPYLTYHFQKDAYFLDYGQAGKDLITEQQARKLVLNNKVRIACEIPKRWLR